MSGAQDFIDSLRNNDFFKVLDLADYVAIKYTKIKSSSGNSEPLAADELVQLMIYELCKTDINDADIEKINFIYNYICSHFSMSISIYGCKITNIASPASIALALKKHPDFENVMNSVELTDRDQLKEFLKDNSPFSTLATEVDNRTELRALTTPLARDMLFDKIRNMGPSEALVFQTEISRIKKEEEIEINCPFNQAFEDDLKREESLLKNKITKACLVKDKLAELKQHLEKKLINQGVLVEEGKTPEKLTSKQEKLLIRYTSIDELSVYCSDKLFFDQQDKKKINESLDVFLANEPNWYERTAAQIIIDVLTLWITAGCRSFFSTESKYKKDLIVAVNNDEQDVDDLQIAP